MKKATTKKRAPRNRTMELSNTERQFYHNNILTLTRPVHEREIENRIIAQNLLETLAYLPTSFVDLLFIDPPYNLNKSFNGTVFKERPLAEYTTWFESWFPKLLRVLKPTASVYICGDWRTSLAIPSIAAKYLIVRNRITWEREKGRGASANWKNSHEDIWFCTVSDAYYFNAEAVKLKRRVVAPYTDAQGNPKDWAATPDGNYRLTAPSNLWTDLTIPFWSMPENTDHPTQKPEKLAAKIILASSQPNDLVLDPFLGSGTTAAAAKKLGRRYVGIEREISYCCLAEKRLAAAEFDQSIQGYTDGVFWERNTLQKQKATSSGNKSPRALPLFDVPIKQN